MLPAKQYPVQLNMEERRDLKGLAWRCATWEGGLVDLLGCFLEGGLRRFRFSATGFRPSDTTTRLAAAWVLASASPTVGYPPSPMSRRLPLTPVRWTQDLHLEGAMQR